MKEEKKYRLLPQTKQMVEEMKADGYPLCIPAGEWSGKYPRHCNACIEMHRKEIITKIKSLRGIDSDTMKEIERVIND
jgi:Zn-finger protein